MLIAWRWGIIVTLAALFLVGCTGTMSYPPDTEITIEGIVCDYDSNQPVAGVKVTARSDHSDDSALIQETYTDQQGRYRISGKARYRFRMTLELKIDKDPLQTAAVLSFEHPEYFKATNAFVVAESRFGRPESWAHEYQRIKKSASGKDIPQFSPDYREPKHAELFATIATLQQEPPAKNTAFLKDKTPKIRISQINDEDVHYGWKSTSTPLNIPVGTIKTFITMALPATGASNLSAVLHFESKAGQAYRITYDQIPSGYTARISDREGNFVAQSEFH
ncbi:hypothetical protein CMV30_09780 [Nibricoccus aquaticus]|uniref:Carboxypeptidase regulatory-like domain-containing protein n=1 Tax=Nibricoccus aquaticus TaxID=2576891 RepID=A0A290QK24_9BACT|nr:carboxypeptidase-like regulatory domain-containing protein [Nibricoccus aquaticus]ATC64222.1 hypothetical protein CMV30_09780 [Nibricoccus aquaticus]